MEYGGQCIYQDGEMERARMAMMRQMIDTILELNLGKGMYYDELLKVDENKHNIMWRFKTRDKVLSSFLPAE